MEKISSHLGSVTSSNKVGGARRLGTGFVGNYIHETSKGGWFNYSKRQRPSKLTRLRRNRNNKKEEKAVMSSREILAEGVAQVRSSESGYDTTGDSQIPRVSSKEERKEMKEGVLHFSSISSHAGGLGDGSEKKSKDIVNINDVESSSLRKLLRDLNRCDVSIRRYQNSLQQVSKHSTSTPFRSPECFHYHAP